MSSSQSQNTIPFSHAAAGHAGISTSADGTLLIKPCTTSEITFYEAAREHPNFQAHMPVFMGSLTLNDSPEEQVAVGVLRHAQTRRDSKGAEVPVAESSSSTTGADPSAPSSTTATAAGAGHIVTDPTIQSSPTKQWTPSGGAKLTSNLSIVLSNATAGFVKPNIIDLKLGARLWDDDAPEAKRAKLDEVSNSSTSSSLGFRVAGMKVYVGAGVHDQDGSDEAADATEHTTLRREVNTTIGNGYKTYDKFYGRSNIRGDGSNIASAFDSFLYSLSLSPTGEMHRDEESKSAQIAARKKLLVSRLLREVESIQFVLENEESRMYSASILMVYEGDPDALNSAIEYLPPASSASSSKKSEGLTAKAKAGVDPLFVTSSREIAGDDGAEDNAIEFQDVEEVEDMDVVEMEASDDDDDDAPKQKIHEVVLIDFAHAKFVKGEGPDENALKGVRSVRTILEGLLA